MQKIAETAYPIHELIAHRWSPRAFSETPVETEKLFSVLEAARWASSSSNSQPWRYLIATKAKPEEHARLLATLVEFNQRWAAAAPVLIIAVARRTYEHNGNPNHHAWYDLGQATAQLALQATALGLQVHQMGGFSADKVRETFDLPEDFEAVTAIALGYPDSPDILPEPLKQREIAPRSRNPIESFVFSGEWGRPFIAEDNTAG